VSCYALRTKRERPSMRSILDGEEGKGDERLAN